MVYSVNILKIIEMCPLKGWILWYELYLKRDFFFFKGMNVELERSCLAEVISSSWQRRVRAYFPPPNPKNRRQKQGGTERGYFEVGHHCRVEQASLEASAAAHVYLRALSPYTGGCRHFDGREEMGKEIQVMFETPYLNYLPVVDTTPSSTCPHPKS